MRKAKRNNPLVTELEDEPHERGMPHLRVCHVSKERKQQNGRSGLRQRKRQEDKTTRVEEDRRRRQNDKRTKTR